MDKLMKTKIKNILEGDECKCSASDQEYHCKNCGERRHWDEKQNNYVIVEKSSKYMFCTCSPGPDPDDPEVCKLEHQERKCRKCRQEYHWSVAENSWVKSFTMKYLSEHDRESRVDARDAFVKGVNTFVPKDAYGRKLEPGSIVQNDEFAFRTYKRGNVVNEKVKTREQYREEKYMQMREPKQMWNPQAASGVAGIDQKKTLDQKGKEVSTIQRVICMCDDRKFRIVIYEHVGQKIRLLFTQLKETPVKLGDEVGHFEWNASYQYAGMNVLVIHPLMPMGRPCPQGSMFRKEILL